MRDCSDFYWLRDRRTREYLGGTDLGDTPVHVVIDTRAAACPAGQLALLALANQLARAHRRISFSIPDHRIPVIVRSPFEGTTLGEALLEMVGSIDPCGMFLSSHSPEGPVVSIGLGAHVGGGLDWYLALIERLRTLTGLLLGSRRVTRRSVGPHSPRA